jgi:hypothetical protein
MTRALRAELLKLSTTRTFLALVGAAVGLSLLVIVLITTIQDQFTADDLHATFASDASSLFILLLGAIGMAGEWRHQTIASTVLAMPQRLKLLLAKVFAYAVAGVVLSAIVNAVIFGVGTLILSSRGIDTLSLSDAFDVIWRNLAIAALFGPLGVCVGALLRNPAGAIVLLLALQFIFEPTLFALAPDVGKYGPLVGVPAGITGGAGVDDQSDVLDTGVAILVELGWLAALFAAAAATITRRDLV